MTGLPAAPTSELEAKIHPLSPIHSDAPWPRARDRLQHEEWDSDAETDPTLQTRFKDSLYLLRTEIAGEPGLTRREILFVMVLLVILFFVIWMIVRSVLLLEIEADVHRQTFRNAAGYSRFTFPFIG
jgi:hypothetical protein